MAEWSNVSIFHNISLIAMAPKNSRYAIFIWCILVATDTLKNVLQRSRNNKFVIEFNNRRDYEFDMIFLNMHFFMCYNNYYNRKNQF